MTDILRTPEDRFDNLPGYNFKANYIEISDQLRMHYVDEGPKDGEIIFLLHGEPSWSYLYRKMIPPLSNAGFRVIAPDLIGFGKSDKPIDRADYSYENHLKWLRIIFNKFSGQKVHLFLQDWGGLLGLRLLEEYEHTISHIVLANTFLPAGQIPPRKAFVKWKQFSQHNEAFDIGWILDISTTSDLSPEIIAAYNAPFPDESYKAGARSFPVLVPLEFADEEAAKNREVWEYLKSYSKPVLTLFSDSDPIMSGAERIFHDILPGTKNMPHEIIENAGHFLQEDKGEELAEKMINFIQNY